MKFVSYFLLTYGILYDNNGITKQLAKQIVNAQSIVIFSLKYLLTKQISRVWSLGIFVLYGAQCFLSNRPLVFCKCNQSFVLFDKKRSAFVLCERFLNSFAFSCYFVCDITPVPQARKSVFRYLASRGTDR